MAWWNAEDQTKRVSPSLGKPSKNKGRVWSEKRRKAYTEGVKINGRAPQRERTSEEKKKASVAKLQYWQTDEGKKTKEKISRSIKEKIQEGSYIHVDWKKVNSHHSERMKLLWQDEKYRKLMVEAARQRSPNENVRKKISSTLKGRKQPKRTEEHCANLSKSLNKPETLSLLAQIAAKNRTKQAKPNSAEKRLEEMLNRNFPLEFKLNVKDGVVIGGKVPDFVDVNGKKLLVELFGDYWHGELITGRSKEDEERLRASHFSKWGFKTVVIWESELANEELICRKIREKYDNLPCK